MMRVIVLGVQVISAFHAFIGLVSVCVGVVSSIQAEVWLAHSVSPIWSGGFFLITGILGFLCSKKKTAYLIMCLTAFSVVSLVTAVVSIQLLRLGLVNHTTDGHTFQKEHKDVLIIIALVAAGTECIVCLVSSVFSCRMAKAVKKELFKQREGMFHVKDDGDDQNYTAESSIAFDNLSVEARRYGIEGDGYQVPVGVAGNDVTGPDDDDGESLCSQTRADNTNTSAEDGIPYYSQEQEQPSTPWRSLEQQDSVDCTDDIYQSHPGTMSSVHLDDVKLGVTEKQNSAVHCRPMTPRRPLCRETSHSSVDVTEVDT